jgi:hypothetical protein
LPEAVGLDAETVNSKYGQAVIRACDRYFADLVPNREGKDNLYTHLNRSIYATIATFWYCPPNVNDVEFKAAIQGHYAILDENNPEIKRSLTASRHYSDYEIADAVIANYGGKRKGVKLGVDGVQVISEFQKQIEATTENEKPKQKKKLSSVRIWRDDKPLLDEIFERLGLDEQLNQSEKMGQLLQWANEHLEDQPTTPLSELEVTKPSKTIPEIPTFQDELTSEITTHDDEPDETTVVVSPPNAFNALDIIDTSQPLSQNVAASGLEAKIDKLVDVMTQFIDLQMQEATQPLTHQPTRTKVKATTQAKPITAISDTPENNQVDQTNCTTFLT